ncbi:hypothetical protein C492_22312 [Natronococcus jeotgali DSM 18795]|uniref:Uncharacterized protein n=1 Tax=Natronococcus jeotgali DSM 18795 TaxID=1227498 RepID=L9WMY2_9EURY|nr:hypothetical protein C492_22312 [Natronococcus jeotgali DSM 18795]
MSDKRTVRGVERSRDYHDSAPISSGTISDGTPERSTLRSNGAFDRSGGYATGENPGADDRRSTDFSNAVLSTETETSGERLRLGIDRVAHLALVAEAADVPCRRRRNTVL